MLRREFPGAWVQKFFDMANSGIPDMVIIFNEYTVWVELKIKTGRLSKIQIEVHKRMRAAGADIAVCKTVNEVREVLLY